MHFGNAAGSFHPFSIIAIVLFALLANPLNAQTGWPVKRTCIVGALAPGGSVDIVVHQLT